MAAKKGSKRPSSVSPVRQWLDQGYSAFDEGELETALTLAEKVLKEEAENRDAWLLKAVSLDGVGQTEEAMAAFETLTTAHPDDAEAWVRMADACHHSLGDLDGALELLQTALQAAEPQDDEDDGDEEMAFEAHLRMVEVYLDLGEHEQALRHAEVARSMDRDSADAEVARGQVMFEMGNMEEAEKAAARGVDKDNRHGGAYFLRALVLERKGDAAGAVRAMERACTLEPESFVRSIQRTQDQVRAQLQDAVAKLPEKLRTFYSNMEIMVSDLPADQDLPSAGGVVSPGARLALEGPPLNGDTTPRPRPQALRVYRQNALRGCQDDDELREVLQQALVVEAAELLDLNEAELNELLAML